MLRCVIVRPEILRDLARIARSIGTNVSATSAIRWRMRIESAIRSLANDAEQWPEADEAVALGLNLRFHSVGRRPHVYRILFTFDDAAVDVFKIRHASQDYITEDDL